MKSLATSLHRLTLPSLAALLTLTLPAHTTPPPSSSAAITFHGPHLVTYDSLHNVHVSITPDFSGQLTIVHGPCTLAFPAEAHHTVVRSTSISARSSPDRFVWAVPEDALHDGCLHAFSSSLSPPSDTESHEDETPLLVGRSSPIGVATPRVKRQTMAEVADATGPWFDGVAAMAARDHGGVNAAEARNKSVVIVGGGIAGIATALFLDSVGVRNWRMVESSARIGGRIRTAYLAGSKPEEYQYQELGPMRFPVNVTWADINETLPIQDHKMVFQLGDYLNKLNAESHPELEVNFIPWIQSSPNVPVDTHGFRLPDGTIPRASQVLEDPSLTYPALNASDMDAVAEAEEAVKNFTEVTPERLRAAAANIFEAHKEAIEHGLFHFSEAAYLRYELGFDAETVDYVAGSGNDYMWLAWEPYFSATNWLTVDKGLDSLPRAAYPHLQDRLTLNRSVSGLTWNNETEQIAVNWREDPFDTEVQSEEFDYAVVTAPFTRVRTWKRPQFSSLLTRAIETMNYQQACKVAMHFKSRFWETLDPPIYGGCGGTDIYGLGSICYPSYEINSSRPGVLHASYTSGTPARALAAMSDDQHIAFVLRGMVEIHGEIAAEEYTGHYDRQCWEVDEHQVGGWAYPTVGQQELYMPAYYETQYNTIFAGEHTTITHGWLFSALDAATRATTQLLLELGLVDEAKQIVEEWMGRWIKV